MKLNPINLKAALARSRRREEADPGSHAGTPPPHVGGYGGGERGVALVITLIMLTVITFMTVTFLVMSTREKGAVTTATDQTVARLAADSGFERAKAELLAGILSTTNAATFGLMVSTTFENPGGFDPGAVFDQRTNVNYNYQQNGSPLTAAQRLQNVANLLYDPRVPVVVTNRLLGDNEFRFFINLNRNVRNGTNVFDPTGVQPVLDNAGKLVPVIPGPGFASNYFVGDPQWIGGLERPDLTHSSTNKFLYRYAFITVPTGKTLDVNYMGNAAGHGRSANLSPLGSDYRRNQGVGTWELNFAAFLSDLNTNDNYGWGPLGNLGYVYDPLSGVIGGKTFEDAAALYSYRLNGNPQNNTYSLNTFNNLYGAVPGAIFANDFVDGYTDGPFQTNYPGLLSDNDQPDRRWSGADNPNHFFTTQEFFDRTKTAAAGGGYKFPDRLAMLGTNLSSYDQNTFYRMLEELGTDSAPEDPGKLNLNYINVPPFAATNFVDWTNALVAAKFGLPLDQVGLVFFTNAANKLLKQYTAEWIGNPGLFFTNFGVSTVFNATNIPVMVGSNFVYRPSVHRLLQLAANLADAGNTNRFPSVFRPLVTRDATGVYISGYKVVAANPVADLLPPMDVNAVPMGKDQDLNVYGVPWIVGAKKGLPNFNEVAMHSVFQITRKLQLTRSSLDPKARPSGTNIMYVIGISNAVGVEAWNSYRANYTNPVSVRISGDITMVLTNEFGVATLFSLPLSNSIALLAGTNYNLWQGYGAAKTPDPRSFAVPLRTNIAFLPESIYRMVPRDFTTNLTALFEAGLGFPQPRWGLVTSARLRFVMQEGGATGRIIDYVQLNDLGNYRDLSEEMRDPDNLTGFAGMWSTNRLGSGPNSDFKVPQGILNQIFISMGVMGGNTADWQDYGLNLPGNGNTKSFEIDYFRVYNNLSPLHAELWASAIKPTNAVAQAPFTPTKRIAQHASWQANDPLVHYTAGDMQQIEKTNEIAAQSLKKAVDLLPNIGVLNERYQPWGGNPSKGVAGDPVAYSVAMKDPLMSSSDNWEFPANKLPNLGWLGRVHRGSPWQTVYMKASGVDGAAWQKWTGNGDPNDAARTQPASDRSLFDLFTTAINENAARGQLPINQSGLAAWSAVFGGLVALTNSSTDAQLNGVGNGGIPIVKFDPLLIQPAGAYDAANTNTWPAMVKLVEGINRERANTNNHLTQTFTRLGDIFSVPELTEKSPFLNTNSTAALQMGLNDQAYEWLPQQVISLLRVGEPRFVIYSYGQALRPADNSVYTAGGAFFGMVTNYQIAAEVATRAVVRVEGSPAPGGPGYPPHIVVESFNQLPPD